MSICCPLNAPIAHLNDGGEFNKFLIENWNFSCMCECVRVYVNWVADLEL